MKLTSISEQMIDPSEPPKPGGKLVLPGQQGSIARQIDRKTDVPKIKPSTTIPKLARGKQELKGQAGAGGARRAGEAAGRQSIAAGFQKDFQATQTEFAGHIERASELEGPEANELIAQAARAFAKKLRIWGNEISAGKLPATGAE